MLKKSNFTYENIKRLQAETGRDPSLLERTVFAFGLLILILVLRPNGLLGRSEIERM